MTALAGLIHRHRFDARHLVAEFPPRFTHPNKRAIYDLASPKECPVRGEIVFSRWSPLNLTEATSRLSPHTRMRDRGGYFVYDTPVEGQIDWHMNFAHYDLFCAYGGPLFAQDEMQVAEHPSLASLRHALQHKGIPPLCVEDRIPTPALISGVERRCVVHTDPDPGADRPLGLYGNRFAAAPVTAVRKATEVLKPPTVGNILAMEAPACGSGVYEQREIGYILATAITGFSATVLESRMLGFSAENVVVHTGYWGCGAYGGNPVLMLLLQMLAARCAGVGELVIHLGSNDRADYLEAVRRQEQLLPEGSKRSLVEVINEVEWMKFTWGVSNGT
jgi:hypothetical protein